jgi:type I restriction enzyme S subunit
MRVGKPLVAAHSESTLPEGWACAVMDEMGKWSTGGTPSRKVPAYFGGGISWVKSGDLKDGAIFHTAETISRAGLENSAATLLPPGTVAIALYGATIGKVGILEIEAATNQACANCRVNEEITTTQFVFYYVLQQRDSLVAAGQGGAQPNLTNQIIRDWPIPLPPLAEQRRIVEKVERLLASLKASRARLSRVPTILKRFRQAVLSAACSGRLTENWREEKSDLESATTLVAGISHPPKRGRSRLEIPRAPEADHLPKVPAKWCYASLDQIVSEPLANGRSVPDGKEGFPVLRLTAIKNRRIKLDERKIGAWTASEATRFLIRRNDFLVARGNGSLSLVGRGGLVNCDPAPVAYPDTLIRVRVSERINPEYLALFWDSGLMRTQIESKAHTTAGIHKISQQDMLEFVLAIPPTKEQHEIVRRVDALFKLTDAIEKHVAAATVRAEKLTQAILAKAFRGELVPTEAELARCEGRSYETASALLARIRVERSVAMPQGQTHQKNRKPPSKEPRKGRPSVSEPAQ